MIKQPTLQQHYPRDIFVLAGMFDFILLKNVKSNNSIGISIAKVAKQLYT